MCVIDNKHEARCLSRSVFASLWNRKKTVVVVARRPREAGFLSTGAHGVNAPDMTPDDASNDRMLILVGEKGQALNSESASKAISRWRSRIPELTPERKGFDLRLYDARGTAAIRLLEANLGLNDIASHMGWSI